MEHVFCKRWLQWLMQSIMYGVNCHLVRCHALVTGSIACVEPPD
jgi:hypothetical protein